MEDHAVEGSEPTNCLVAVALDAAATPAAPTVLVGGADFYASPRVSPDGKSLAWVQVTPFTRKRGKTSCESYGLARGDRKWSLNEGRITNFRVVRAALGTILEREIGERRETAA
jgi:hypothetical protein